MRFGDPRFETRSDEREWLDDLQLEGRALIENLEEIATINRRLGGHRILVDGVRRAIALLSSKQDAATETPPSRTEYHIYDMGCGSGDGLRSIARWARGTAHKVKLIGQDANPHVIAHAKKQSRSYPEIRYEVANALEENSHSATKNEPLTSDASNAPQVNNIGVCSLFLHHLSDEQIRDWITAQLTMNHAVVVSDLERSPFAHKLFAQLARAARFSTMTEHDGLISIRRGFRRRELEQIAVRSQASRFSLRWCWAFRYQMILIA